MGQDISFNFKVDGNYSYDDVVSLLRQVSKNKGFNKIWISERSRYSVDHSVDMSLDSSNKKHFDITFKNKTAFVSFGNIDYNVIRIVALQKSESILIDDIKQFIERVYSILKKSGTGSNELDYDDPLLIQVDIDQLKRKYAGAVIIWIKNCITPRQL